jgi:hypothetical protein
MLMHPSFNPKINTLDCKLIIIIEGGEGGIDIKCQSTD